MPFETLLLDKSDGVATITINRPEKLNALNHTCISELHSVFNTLQDDSETRCIIVTGAGEKAFVAGADIAELSRLTIPEAKALAERGQRVFNAIESSAKPVIAAVNGFALGGGAELAWACHIRLASENAKFGQPEIDLGLIPGYGGTQRLPRLLPRSKATELLLTGDRIDAQTALHHGLISYCVPLPELLPKARALAERIASKPAVVVSFLLGALRAVPETPLSAGLGVEASFFSLCFGTEDFKEGTAAFLEKRKAQFTHR